MLWRWHLPHQLYFHHVLLNKWITFCLCVYSSSIWCIFNPLTLFISVTQSSSKFLQVSGRQVGERWRLLIHSLGERIRRESFWEREIFNSLALIKASLGICFRSDSHESTTGKSIGSQAELALLLSLADFLWLTVRILHLSNTIFLLSPGFLSSVVAILWDRHTILFHSAAQLRRTRFL